MSYLITFLLFIHSLFLMLSVKQYLQIHFIYLNLYLFLLIFLLIIHLLSTMTVSMQYFFDHFINHSLIQVVPITILLFIHVNSIWHLIMLYGLFDLKYLDLHCSLLNSELFQFPRFTLHTLIDHFYFHICLFTLYLIRSIQLIFQPFFVLIF